MARKRIWNFRKEQPASHWSKCIPEEFPQIKKQKRIIDDLLGNPDFKRSILDLRKKCKIKVEELAELFNELTEAVRLNNSQNVNFINKKLVQYCKQIKNQEIIKLLKRFKLSPLWFNPVYQYLTQNKLAPIEIKCDIICTEDGYGRDRILIEVFADTILEDIKEAWNSVNEYQKRLPDYYRKTIREPKNKTIHTDILKWFALGKSSSEVYKLLGEKYPDYETEPESLRKIKERGKKRDIKKLS